jgi:hypothetical protein
MLAVECRLSYRKSCSLVPTLSALSAGSNAWSTVLILHVPCFAWQLIYVPNYSGYKHGNTITQPMFRLQVVSGLSLTSSKDCRAPREVHMVFDGTSHLVLFFQSLLYCSNSCTSLHFKTLKSHTKTLKIRIYTFRSHLKPSSGGSMAVLRYVNIRKETA